MSTTVVFAELLIVGIQAIVWLLLVLLSLFGINWIKVDVLNFLKDWVQIITVFVLAFAYTFGIIIDRISDSFLNPISKNIKKRYIDNSLPKITYMRLYIKTQSQPLNDYIDYIRSRQRIARSTAFNIFLTMIGLWLLYFIRLTNKVDIIIIFSINICLLVMCGLSIFVWMRISETYFKRLKKAYLILKENEQNSFKNEEKIIQIVEEDTIQMGGLKIIKPKTKPKEKEKEKILINE